MSVVNIVVSVLFDIAELARVSAVPPVTSPVWVAFDTNELYRLFTALSPVFVPLDEPEKFDAERVPVKSPFPVTDNASDGEVVPIPTLPLSKIVTFAESEGPIIVDDSILLFIPLPNIDV